MLLKTIYELLFWRGWVGGYQYIPGTLCTTRYMTPKSQPAINKINKQIEIMLYTLDRYQGDGQFLLMFERFFYGFHFARLSFALIRRKFFFLKIHMNQINQ